jgi:hypothetical protein
MTDEEDEVLITKFELLRALALAVWCVGVIGPYYLLKAYLYDDEDLLYEGLEQRLQDA